MGCLTILGVLLEYYVIILLKYMCFEKNRIDYNEVLIRKLYPIESISLIYGYIWCFFCQITL